MKTLNQHNVQGTGNLTPEDLGVKPVIRDTADGFVADNPILALDQIGYETDTGKIKIGDGTTRWNLLQYSGGGSATTNYGSDGIIDCGLRMNEDSIIDFGNRV